MRAFALKFCQGIYIFQFTNNVWLQYTSQAYQMNCDWSKRAKTGEYPRIFPNFKNCARCKKYLKDNKDNSLHLRRKYARIFVLGHYLFLVAHSFPRASLSESCSPLGTDNVCGQISEHIFAPNGDYCLYILQFLLDIPLCTCYSSYMESFVKIISKKMIKLITCMHYF